MCNNRRRIILQFKISHLLGEACRRAASVEAAINGFVRSGIWPVNSDISQESDFVTSTLRDHISNNDGNIEEPSECFEGTLSPRGSTIWH